MPKGVLWRQHDVFVSSMGGRYFGTDDAMAGSDEVAERASQAPGFASILLIPPLMHGAAQWGAFQIRPSAVGWRFLTMWKVFGPTSFCGLPSGNG